MAVVGGIILILIAAFIIWIALMNKFKNIGEKIINKIRKTFSEEQEKKNESSN